MALVEVFENQPFTSLQREEIASLRHKLGARIRRHGEGWVIVRVVGRVALPTGRVLRIRSPKAPAAAMLAWIAYVDRTLQALSAPVLPAVADNGDVLACLAWLYIEALVSTCTRHGLVRGYRPEGVRSPCIRGRIDFPRLIAEGHNLARVPCVAWLRAPDTPLNRFLAAALERVIGDPILRSQQELPLQAVTRWFNGIPATVSPGLLRGHQPLGRSEADFQTAFDIARCILLHSGLGEGSRIHGYSFLVDLESYFERAVIRAFLDAGVECDVKQFLPYDVLYGTKRARRVMAPDLICHLDDGPLIVDAKFKHDVSSANIQQMVTYCVLTGARRAVLVVPAGGEFADAYVLPIPGGSSIEIRIVELGTLGCTMSAWREYGATLVECAVGKLGKRLPGVATGAGRST